MIWFDFKSHFRRFLNTLSFSPGGFWRVVFWSSWFWLTCCRRVIVWSSCRIKGFTINRPDQKFRRQIQLTYPTVLVSPFNQSHSVYADGRRGWIYLLQSLSNYKAKYAIGFIWRVTDSVSTGKPFCHSRESGNANNISREIPGSRELMFI
jgi:hypothetical protein